ncbi:cyclin-D5-3-like [Trifolium pratense]|uniref:cyclin-D5-3-like n=1 Tax=Trifolium pratense TaxID=57577 RepID=UPI001E692F42|nr:cyclin-D5-3-like [Trifolium pratense]
MDTSFLLCDDEDHAFLFMQNNDYNENITINSLNQNLNSKYEKEYIEYLFTLENRKFPSFSYCFKSTIGHVDFNNILRINALDHIFKIQEKLGFKLCTAYLSVTYFDQFLLKQHKHIHEERYVQLLSVACSSLAAKMMEERDLPLLFKYITETYEEQGFVDMPCIVEMEVEVFSTLEWELPTVTPFDFLRYFVYLFCTEYPQEPLISQAVEHVLAILKDVNLMDHRPSTIALAATLMVAFDAALTREIMDLHIGEILLQLNLDSVSFISSLSGFCFLCNHK